MKLHASGDPAALQRIREFHPRFYVEADAAIRTAVFKLSDAQLTIAREYGFTSWPRLKARIEKPTPADDASRRHDERIDDAGFRHAVQLLDSGDEAALRLYLTERPEIVHRVMFQGGNYFRNPSLLEFIAENPIRHGKLPKNIVEITRVILDAGARADQESMDSTLALVCSGRVPRECGVQVPLIDLLCHYGAKPDQAMLPALAHGEFGAAEALLARGATRDLAMASAMGRLDEAQRLLPVATRESRHRALALAAQHGHAEIVRLLLEAGEDPSRYNPVGCHSHSTPLHQAAWGRHQQAVKVLVEHGARLDVRDILFSGTPADWAQHAGYAEIETYLRERDQASGREHT